MPGMRMSATTQATLRLRSEFRKPSALEKVVVAYPAASSRFSVAPRIESSSSTIARTRRDRSPAPKDAPWEFPLKPGEALVKVRLAGVCGTDLEMVKGYYPFTGILGHEFVGQIANLPSGHSRHDWVGKRVVGEINASCGTCEQCRGGRPTHCENRTVLGILNRDGVFAEYASLPLENLHLVPDSVSDEAAVFVEPLAAALEIQQQVQIKPTDRILLVGAGRLGQLIAQTLALTGADLRVVARHPLQQKLLTERGIRKVVKLAVSVPSHTPLMREAANRLSEAMASLSWQAPALPVVQNVDGEVHDGVQSVRDALVRQLYLPVQWTSCVQALAAGGATRIAECGPGKVLAGLAKRIDKTLDARSLGAPGDFDAALADWKN